MTLYVIGNGFDIAHNIPVRYTYFRDYVKNKNTLDTFSFMEELFDLDQDWNNFEAALAKPKELGKTIDDLEYGVHVRNEIKKLFEGWILETDAEVMSKDKTARFDDSSIFFTFNYTSTLETLYGVDLKRICHIHGFVVDKYFFTNESNYDLVFGHGEKSKHDLDISLKAHLYKDTEGCFYRSKKFLEDSSYYIDKIVVIGFSYSLIDIYYFQKMKEMMPTAKWYCGYHNDNDVKNRKVFMDKLGIKDYIGKFSNLELMKGFYNK